MGVEVAPEVFALDDDDHANEHVMITGSSDPRAAGAALSRAALRFMMVTEDGRELSDDEAEALEEAAGTAGHCKGYIWPVMRERMIAILVEELERAGVSGRVEVPPSGELDYGAPALDPWGRLLPRLDRERRCRSRTPLASPDCPQG